MTSPQDAPERTEPVPFSTLEACIEVAGTALYYRDRLETLLKRAGVTQSHYDRHRGTTSKYTIVRGILDDLERDGPRGWSLQQRIVQQFANLTDVEPSVPDRAAGLDALKRLKAVAMQENVLVDPAQAERDQRRADAAAEQARTVGRQDRVAKLNRHFIELHKSSNPQRRGYELESLLGELFRLYEIEYRPPYKSATDQVDGWFKLDSFSYLIEAKWRSEPPNAADLYAFNGKVEHRIDATRGFFISMNGFSDEAVNLHRQGKENRLIFADGQDLALILGGAFAFDDALRLKVEAAAVRGEPYQKLSEL